MLPTKATGALFSGLSVCGFFCHILQRAARTGEPDLHGTAPQSALRMAASNTGRLILALYKAAQASGVVTVYLLAPGFSEGPWN